MKFSVLASGSRANSTVVVSGNTTLLVDCGLSAKETFLRLRLNGISESSITGILISHEHDDHIKGVKALARYTGVPVYMTEATYHSSNVLQSLEVNQIRFFDSFFAFSIGDVEIFPFSVSHDATDPVCFKFSYKGKSLGILSDLGCFSQSELDIMQDVDALLLEANHDLDKLWKTHYPWHVKQRIAGNRGHLSNDCASRFLFNLEKRLTKVPKVILAAHISENSNSWSDAKCALVDAWKGVESPFFDSAPQYEPTELFEL